MKLCDHHRLLLSYLGIFFGCLFICIPYGMALDKALVTVDRDKVSHYKVPCGEHYSNPEEIERVQQFEGSIIFITINSSQLKLHRSKSINFGKVYETMFDEERLYLSELFRPKDSITLQDLLSMSVDIYVEEETGISVMIPTQCVLSDSTDNYGTHSTTKSPGGLVSLSFYISPNEHMIGGMNAMNVFREVVKKSGQVLPSENDSLELAESPFYYNKVYQKISVDKKAGSTRAIFDVNMTVKDGNFLAVTLNVPDWPPVSKNRHERLFFYLMETCRILSGFTI